MRGTGFWGEMCQALTLRIIFIIVATVAGEEIFDHARPSARFPASMRDWTFQVLMSMAATLWTVLQET